MSQHGGDLGHEMALLCGESQSSASVSSKTARGEPAHQEEGRTRPETRSRSVDPAGAFGERVAQTEYPGRSIPHALPHFVILRDDPFRPISRTIYPLHPLYDRATRRAAAGAAAATAG